jgi:hypothetical protein
MRIQLDASRQVGEERRQIAAGDGGPRGGRAGLQLLVRQPPLPGLVLKGGDRPLALVVAEAQGRAGRIREVGHDVSMAALRDGGAVRRHCV